MLIQVVPRSISVPSTSNIIKLVMSLPPSRMNVICASGAESVTAVHQDNVLHVVLVYYPS